MNELLHLYGELCIANTAGSKLHVFRMVALLQEPRLHFTQRIQRAEIEIAAVHERLQNSQQRVALFDISGTGTCLDERVSLPTTALCLEVMLDRGAMHHERPAVAVGSKPHVHAKNTTVDRHGIQRIDQLLTNSCEKLLVSLARFRRALLRIGEDEIDVRREVQLFGAELAERQDNESLPLAGTRCRRPVTGYLPSVYQVERRIDDVIGHHRHDGNGFLQRALSKQMPPDNPQLTTITQLSQSFLQRRHIFYVR